MRTAAFISDQAAGGSHLQGRLRFAHGRRSSPVSSAECRCRKVLFFAGCMVHAFKPPYLQLAPLVWVTIAYVTTVTALLRYGISDKKCIDRFGNA